MVGFRILPTKGEPMSINIGSGGGSCLFKDFGCDVNCDVDRPKMRIPNFVRCDAQYLPFKEKSFSKVVLSHVIEHLENPDNALRESRRICNGKLIIFIPSCVLPFTHLNSAHLWIIVRGHFIPNIFAKNTVLKQIITKIFKITHKAPLEEETRFNIYRMGESCVVL